MDDAGVRPADLARESSVSKGYLSSLLSGDKTEPSAKVCSKFAEVLGVTVRWLMTGEERTEKPKDGATEEPSETVKDTGLAVMARMERIERNLAETTANLAKMSGLLADFMETFKKGPEK